MSEDRKNEWTDKLTKKLEEFEYSGEVNDQKVESFFDRMDINEKVEGNFSFMKIAASIALMVMAGVAGYLLMGKTVATNPGELAQHELPDGSVVEIGYDSELKYNRIAWMFNRKVSLDGEAYFNVEKGSKFSVLSENGSTQVLGTQFNVVSQSNRYKVECFEGKVSVSSNDQEVELTAGKGVQFSSNKKVEIQVKADKPSWLTNEMQFNAETYLVVLEELSRVYDVSFEGDVEFDRSDLYTGFFPTNDLDRALKLVFDPMDVSYAKKKDRKILLSKHKK